MLFIQILLFVLAGGGLVYLLWNRNKNAAGTAFDGEYQKVEREFNVKEQEYKNIEADIFEIIDSRFGTKVSDDIKNGIVTVGMPSVFLNMAWGHPRKIVRDDVDNSIERWYYAAIEKADAYETEVTIQNKLILSLKDI